MLVTPFFITLPDKDRPLGRTGGLECRPVATTPTSLRHQQQFVNSVTLPCKSSTIWTMCKDDSPALTPGHPGRSVPATRHRPAGGSLTKALSVISPQPVRPAGS